LVGKPQGKRLLGRPKHRWVNNIKIHDERTLIALIWLRIGISGELV
jgi:hypothetical protein